MSSSYVIYFYMETDKKNSYFLSCISMLCINRAVTPNSSLDDDAVVSSQDSPCFYEK